MSTRFRGWLLVVSIGVAAAGFGCGPHKRGTIPVDSPIYQAPNDDPSSEEEEEKPAPAEGEEGSSSLKPAAKPARAASKEDAATVRR